MNDPPPVFLDASVVQMLNLTFNTHVNQPWIKSTCAQILTLWKIPNCSWNPRESHPKMCRDALRLKISDDHSCWNVLWYTILMFLSFFLGGGGLLDGQEHELPLWLPFPSFFCKRGKTLFTDFSHRPPPLYSRVIALQLRTRTLHFECDLMKGGRRIWCQMKTTNAKKQTFVFVVRPLPSQPSRHTSTAFVFNGPIRTSVHVKRHWRTNHNLFQLWCWH